MIHVCFAQYDANGRYSKFTGTAMLSLFENSSTPPRRVHILHDNTLTKDNRDKFIYLAGRYRQLVKFYNVEELCADRIAEIKELFPTAAKTRYTIGMFYRFFIPQVLSPDIGKAIYLDSDTIVNLDISELWRVDLDYKPLGAIAEIGIESDPLSAKEKKYLVKNNLVAYEDYFNSGVLLLNLNYWRNNEFLTKGFRFVASNPEMTYIDQDILNYLFSKNYVKLAEKFDVFVDKARQNPQIRPAIYHYFDDTLQMDMKDPFSRLWMDYFIKTPWFDSSVFNNLYDGIQRFNKSRQYLLEKFSAIMSGKTRVIVVSATSNINWLEKNYNIQVGDEFFVCDGENFLQELIDKMNAERDKKIFFIRHGVIIEALKDAGFVEGKDFLNHWTYFVQHAFNKRDINTLIRDI